MARSRKQLGKPRPSRPHSGIRLPMAVRKGLVMRFLNSRAGQVLLAEAFVLAAGVFGAEKRMSSEASRAGSNGRVTLAEARDRLSYASLMAMKAFRAALAERDSVVAHVEAKPRGRRNRKS